MDECGSLHYSGNLPAGLGQPHGDPIGKFAASGQLVPSCVTHVEPSWDPEPLEFAFNTNPSITTSSTKNPAIATRMNLMSVLGKERRGDGDAPLRRGRPRGHRGTACPSLASVQAAAAAPSAAAGPPAALGRAGAEGPSRRLGCGPGA